MKGLIGGGGKVNKQNKIKREKVIKSVGNLKNDKIEKNKGNKNVYMYMYLE